VPLTEQQTLALQFYDDNVPCIFQLQDPECVESARWIVVIAHEVADESCPDAEPMPMCETHKRQTQHLYSPFWATWSGGNNGCGGCARALHIASVEPLGT
jgi:hypothetical protein